MSKPKYQHVVVMGANDPAITFNNAIKAAKAAGLSEDMITQYRKEAVSAGYPHLISVTKEWFTCD